MNFPHKLQTLYKPVQPTIKSSEKSVIYREVKPNEKLSDFIYCYWKLQTTETLQTPFNYRVVADGCIDIFFALERPNESFVMGFCKKYTEFPLGNSFHYIGVRFLPSMFPQLFKIDASELSNRYEWLQEILPQISTFILHEFDQVMPFEDIQNVLDAYFLNLLKHKHFDWDLRFYNAMYLILKNFGTLETESALDTGISPRQLRRIFNYYVGTTPKTFSKVVRFQNILHAKPSTESLKQNKLFYDVGFYDQAHFIKDFKNFYGVTPSQAFR